MERITAPRHGPYGYLASIIGEERLALLAAAQDALGREDVDLVLLHRAPPLLSDRIAPHGRLVFSRDEARRIRWLVYTKSRHCDLRPLRTLLDAFLESRVRRGDFGRRMPAFGRG